MKQKSKSKNASVLTFFLGDAFCLDATSATAAAGAERVSSAPCAMLINVFGAASGGEKEKGVHAQSLRRC
jgi:hypothetical protein